MGWSAVYSLCTSRSRDIPLGKRQGRMMASARGWSPASSLLFTRARWCGFFAFKVSGRISPERRMRRATVPPGEMGQPAEGGDGGRQRGTAREGHRSGEPSAKESSVTPALVTPGFRTAQGQSMAKLCKTRCVDIN